MVLDHGRDGESCVSFEERNRGFRHIIRRYIRENRLSARELEAIGAIRNRKTFFKRLERDELTGCELDILFQKLGLDPIRAHVAIISMRDPDEYFEPLSEVASVIAAEIARMLLEQSHASAGNFEPVRRTICCNVARDAVNKIMSHQERTRQYYHDEAMRV